MSSLKPLDAIFNLKDEIENYKLKIQDLKDLFNSGKINLAQYTSKVEEINKKIETISAQISAFEIKMTDQEKILKKEIESLINNFQVELDPQNRTHIKADFYSSTGTYFLIELRCQDYPKHISISFPPELENLIGPPTSINLIKGFPQDPPAHLVDIFHAIEEEIQGKTRLDDEVQNIFKEFDVERPKIISSKLKVRLYSLDAEQFDLEVNLINFPQLPEITLSPKLEKFIFLDSLKSIKFWNTRSSHVVNILREISAILDRKLRINLELKQLKQNDIDAIFDSINSNIQVAFTESEKNPITYKFDIKIPDEYPSSPPTINQISHIEDQEVAEKFHNAINDFIIEWYPASSLAEFFEGLRRILTESSKYLCNVCKNLVCPHCSKNLTGTIPGVQGELECYIQCPHCKKAFHNCCWKEYIKYSQKCPLCQKHISIR